MKGLSRSLVPGGLDTTTAWPELMFSLSSPLEERDGEATFH